MSVNLTKGQKVNLRKENSSDGIKKVMVGLGWDEPQEGTTKYDMDCDASAILCKHGKLVDGKDVVFYNHLKHESGAVAHQGDNLSGGDGIADDEQIFVDLSALNSEYDKIVFVVTIYEAKKRKQHFGLIKNAFIRICDANTGNEFCKYDLAEDYQGKTGLIVGELVREGSEWKFTAIGQGTNDNGILEIIKRFC